VKNWYHFSFLESGHGGNVTESSISPWLERRIPEGQLLLTKWDCRKFPAAQFCSPSGTSAASHTCASDLELHKQLR